MSDNPNKKKLDAKRISQQPWEQAYQRKKNARKKKGAVATSGVSQEGASEHPDEEDLIRLSYNRSKGIILNKRKLESALLKMENAVLQNSTHGKEPFPFCKEGEEKGKPIFNMVLVLFGFSTKTKTVIRRIMNGVDGICSVSQESVVGSR